jgi:hypothetical protein
MDLDEFLRRPSLSPYPISLILRLDDEDDPQAALASAVTLLANRHPLDEILVPSDRGEVPSSRSSTPRIKFIPQRMGNRTGLELAFRLCRWPIIVTYSPQIRLSREKLAEMLRYLDQCDLVAGQRTGVTSWWSWLLERPFRWIFGVPVADPFCPVKAIRGPAVANIVLETDAKLVDFELIAKLTYLTSLMDECPVDAIVPARPLLAELLGNLRALLALYFRASFWDAGHEAREIRPLLNQDSSLPSPPRPQPPPLQKGTWLGLPARHWGPRPVTWTSGRAFCRWQTKR